MKSVQGWHCELAGMDTNSMFRLGSQSLRLKNVIHADKRGTKSMGRSYETTGENITLGSFLSSNCFHVVGHLFSHSLLTAHFDL